MEKNIVVNNIITSYYDIGVGDKVIVYIHGWKSSKELFLKTIEFLQDEYRIIGVDLPGFGNTSWPSKAWNIFEYANFTLDFIKRLNLSDVNIVGHSMGGRILSIIANDSLIKTVIASGAAGLPQRLSTKQKLFKGISKLLRILHIKVPLRVKNLLGSDDYKNSSGISRETLLKILETDLTNQIKEIAKPALLIWGENDDQSPIWMAYKWNELVKNSTLKVIPDCGHFPERDFPELFAKYVKEFVG